MAALRARHPLPPLSSLAIRKAYRSLFRHALPPSPIASLRGLSTLPETSRAFRPGEGGAPAGEGHSISAGRIARSRQRVTRPYPHDIWVRQTQSCLAVRGRLFLLDSHRREVLGYPSRKTSVEGINRQASHLCSAGLLLIHATDSEAKSLW